MLLKCRDKFKLNLFEIEKLFDLAVKVLNNQRHPIITKISGQKSPGIAPGLHIINYNKH